MRLQPLLYPTLHEAENISKPVEKPFNIPLPADLLKISRIFKDSGKQLHLVGGSVRDALMGKQPKDYDLATDATPDQIIEIFKKHPAFKILEIGKAFGVIKVIAPSNEEYEIATFRKDIGAGRRPDSVEFTSIEQDVQRRDLTINALFYDIEKKKIVDYVGGIEDIEKNIVRAVGNAQERFNEDRLRILRALRFAARMGAALDPESSAAIKANNSLVGVSGERIRDEFIKGIKSAKVVVSFLKMIQEYDLWSQILPDLSVSHEYHETKNVPVQLALLLRNNDIKLLNQKLNKLKYPANETAQVVFLALFQQLTKETAYKLKKLFANSHLSDEDLQEFSELSNKPSQNLVAAFKKYKLSVGGEELQSQFSGKALGDEIQRRETEIFYSLL